MGERNWGPKERYFLYLHTEGSFIRKKFFSSGDLKEMLESSFVAEAWEITEEQWREGNRELSPEERASKILSGLDPRELPKGIIRQLK